MHIAIFCHNYFPHPGGLEVVVGTLAQQLSQSDRVTVITTKWLSDSDEKPSGVHVHRVPALHMTEKLGVPYPILTGPGLREALHLCEAADVIHAHGMLYLTTLLAVRAARRYQKPLLVTEHVGFVPYTSRSLRLIQHAAWRSIGRRVLSEAEAITAINVSVAEDVRSYGAPKQLVVIPNGVDTGQFRPFSTDERHEARMAMSIPTDRPVVLFVGRDAPRKRLGDLLSIPRDQFTLVVCGSNQSLPDDVVNLGVLPHSSMPRVFGAADIAIHSAEKESTPLVVREALAAGVPLIVRWDPADRDSLSSDVVVPYDNPQDLGRTLSGLLGDENKRTELSRIGREWAERSWSWETTIAKYGAVYRELADAEVKGIEERRERTAPHE